MGRYRDYDPCSARESLILQTAFRLRGQVAMAGFSTVNGYLVVSFTERDQIVRIISARPMTPSERKAYEQ